MKKILLIAYNFPPIINAQSLRWVQFIKHLVREGYRIDVLTIVPEKGYVGYDGNSLNSVPKEVKVFRSYSGPLNVLINRYIPVQKNIKNKKYKYFSSSVLRQQIKFLYKKFIQPVLVPDEKILWFPWAMKILNKLKKNEYDIVISSAMPVTCHILGYYFKKWTGITWIMDYGDPWVFNPSFPLPIWKYLLESRIEGRLLKKADHILVTTDLAIEGFTKHYPFLVSSKFTVISQGYDKELVENIKIEKGKIFRILYTGTFYDSIRPPYNFFEAISQLNNVEMEILIVGDFQPQYLKVVKKKGLEKKIFFLGHKTHEETIALQKGADILLFLSNDSPYQISGKIFEYLGACRPILGIQFIDNDPAIHLIKKYKRGFVASNDAKEIASTIRKIHGLWQNGELVKHFSFKHIEEHTWAYQAMKLKNLINIVSVLREECP